MRREPTARRIFLHGIGTDVPPNSYTQTFALDFLLDLQGKSEGIRQFLKKVYNDTGIEKRHTVIDDYGKPPEAHTFYPKTVDLKPEPETWVRNDVFVIEANRLAERASRRLLEKLDGFAVSQITHLITVSCTGFSVPGFDIHLVKTLGLRRNVHRLHVGFMGCYASIPALKAARDICLANPEAVVLIVGVEICSLHFQQNLSPEIIVANAIFADGAAAALISSDPALARTTPLGLDTFATHLVDNSETEMAWRIGKHGFDMRLSLYVPALIEMNIKGAVERLLSNTGLTFEDIHTYAIHPGGRAILDRLQEALSLPEHALKVSYDVLREYGNMSSVTILFVLERLRQSAPSGPIFTAAFGPGLTLESAVITKE